jgi:hypothetical protein
LATCHPPKQLTSPGALLMQSEWASLAFSSGSGRQSHRLYFLNSMSNPALNFPHCPNARRVHPLAFLTRSARRLVCDLRRRYLRGMVARTNPPVLHLRVSLRHGHFQRGVGHLKWNELLLVFRPRRSPCGLKPLVKWCRGQRREQAKNGQPWGPSPNRLEGSLRDSGRVRRWWVRSS